MLAFFSFLFFSFLFFSFLFFSFLFFSFLFFSFLFFPFLSFSFLSFPFLFFSFLFFSFLFFSFLFFSFSFFLSFFFFKYILLIFLQRRRERDRELETSMKEIIDQLPLAHPLLGMCPQPMYMPLTGIELGPFSLQTDALSTEPNWFGSHAYFIRTLQRPDSTGEQQRGLPGAVCI
uniref:Uncharacterized protein n=1 Tax=Pipistrellus kuhlii TaxID=59472 RepID=A0A7J7ZJ23_PIPKU|nr:hypothetical protein mPipKuh1_009490 [Pipistrellus kuhlii]